MAYTLPVDLDAERTVVGACLLDDRAIEAARDVIAPSDFSVSHLGHIFAAILDHHATGARPDVPAVHRLIPAEFGIEVADLHELINAGPTISNAERWARAVAEASVRRDLIHAGSDIGMWASGQNDDADLDTVIDRARERIAAIDVPSGRGAPDPDVDSYIGGIDDAYDWLIPGMLERRDRMIVTGGEGSGKSMLLRQIAVMAAAGIHPWTHHACTPRNVLVVDLENPQRLVARSLGRLRAQAGAAFNPQRLRICSRPGGIDLMTRTDRRWLLDRCLANATELLVIGPVYRMSAGVAKKGDIGGEDQARTVTKALDDLRERCGVTLLMETHAPHGDLHGGRDLRPFGSSVWLRWPEFGVGLAKDREDSSGCRYTLGHWRGARDERTWPKALAKNAGRWPWTPEMPTGTFRGAA